MAPSDYTFILEVRDAPGVLVRVAQVFARRGCNISSLHVTPHPDGQWSTMTITARMSTGPIQIQRQLEKLIDVSRATMHKHNAS
ncbi:MAG TPA: acetolactate synthase small subunit [Candidatus Saccharimonadia bacterium]|jgi:acetolactate synthase-1/3 small subunit|nr:acetolactate synthase small subunit [Candidatus Saccharimonadia bacterium]